MSFRSVLLTFALLAPSFAFAESAPKVELGAPYRVVDAKDKQYFKVEPTVKTLACARARAHEAPAM